MKLKTIIATLLISTSLMAAPKAVVFDFGGVMIEKPDSKMIAEFLCETLFLSKKEFKKLHQEKKSAKEQGMDTIHFFKNYAAKNQISLSPTWEEEFVEVMKQSLHPRSEMYAFVEKIKKKNILAPLFSNIDEYRANLLKKMGLYDPFSFCLLSCDLGVEKPDPKAYAILLEALDLQAEDIVFIDDREENVEAARKFGIDAIHFKSVQQIKEELLKRKVI